MRSLEDGQYSHCEWDGVTGVYVWLENRWAEVIGRERFGIRMARRLAESRGERHA